MRWLIFTLIAVPVVELSFLIYSGKVLGFFSTILILLITGIGGAFLAKWQGTKAWNELKSRTATMETPGNALIDSVCIFGGGVLLLFPGYLTDIFGLLLLFNGPRNLIRPTIQKWIYKKMKNGRIIMM